MTKYVLLSFLFVFMSQIVGAQKFSLKQTQKSYPKLKNMRLADLPLDVLYKAEEMSKHMHFAENKKKVDALRKRRFVNKLDKTYSETTQSITPQLGVNFNGHPTGSRGIPNDNNMAISNDGWIVSVQNSIVRVFNPNGEAQLIRSLEFMASGQVGRLERSFDPKIMYDPLADRFIMVFLEGNTSTTSKIIVGFSQSNLPTGQWSFYALDGSPFGDKRWSDYPIIAFNESDLFITVNMLEDGGSWIEDFAESVIWQVSLRDGYNGMEQLSTNLLSDITFNEKYIWSVCPVKCGSAPNRDETMYFLSVRPGDLKNDTLFLHTLSGNVRSESKYQVEVFKSPLKYGIPPSGFQPNGGKGLHTNDARVLDAFFEQNKIQYVQTTNIIDKNMPGVYHGILDLDKREIQANYIYSDTFDYAYPSIAFAGNHKFPNASVITFSHSSELNFPGTSAIFYNQIDGYEGIYSKILKVKEGKRLINYSTNDSNVRWGDYTSIQTKYGQEGILWLSGSFGDENQPSGYGTWLAQLSTNPKLHVQLDEGDMQLFPNPSNAMVNLQVFLNAQKTLKVTVCSQLGQKVYESSQVTTSPGLFNYQLSTDFLAKGLYILSISELSGKPIISKKLIVR